MTSIIIRNIDVKRKHQHIENGQFLLIICNQCPSHAFHSRLLSTSFTILSKSNLYSSRSQQLLVQPSSYHILSHTSHQQPPHQIVILIHFFIEIFVFHEFRSAISSFGIFTDLPNHRDCNIIHFYFGSIHFHIHTRFLFGLIWFGSVILIPTICFVCFFFKFKLYAQRIT